MRFKNTSLLWRILLCFGLFLVISGTLGPMIINHSLVKDYGFEIYGGTGKALIFAAISFGFLVYRQRRDYQPAGWHKNQLLWSVPMAGAYALAATAIIRLQHGTTGVIWPLLTHVGLVTTVVCLILLTIGWPELKHLYYSYRRQVWLALGLGIGFYVFLELVYNLWEVLSNVVMLAVKFLLDLGGLEVYIIPPRTILLSKFAVEISQFCSGIESIALFTGLYVIIGLVDRSRLNFKKYAAIFGPALVALFACNILRVYGLILAAYYINPHIAFSLFHTYAGMVFFILYSAVFWRLAYGWMLRRPAKATAPSD